MQSPTLLSSKAFVFTLLVAMVMPTCSLETEARRATECTRASTQHCDNKSNLPCLTQAFLTANNNTSPEYLQAISVSTHALKGECPSGWHWSTQKNDFSNILGQTRRTASTAWHNLSHLSVGMVHATVCGWIPSSTLEGHPKDCCSPCERDSSSRRSSKMSTSPASHDSARTRYCSAFLNPGLNHSCASGSQATLSHRHKSHMYQHLQASLAQQDSDSRQQPRRFKLPSRPMQRQVLKAMELQYAVAVPLEIIKPAEEALIRKSDRQDNLAA
eukprot:2608994-Amphidinium_carterae.1